MALAAGELIANRYRLDHRLATGGSADVWLARDERLDRQVAIKVLQAGLLPDEASRARFAAESRATAALSHPAIVPVHDVIEDEAHPAIVLRYIEGATLAELLDREGPVSVKAAAEIGADLAGALAHAHRAGVVHLDVKPGNVLVDTDRHVHLVDFGIARSVGAGPAPSDPRRPKAAREGAQSRAREARPGGNPAPRQVIGTLRYMAPEQLAGTQVNSRSDLFALGLVLHELLTGRPAYTATDPAELLAAQQAGPPAAPAGAPRELTALIRELLAVDPAARPADAGEVEARLRAIAASAADQPVAPAPGAVPTIVPGLPAASAGLAFVAPAGLDLGPDRRERPPKRATGPEPQDLHDPNVATMALAAPPTARVDALEPEGTEAPAAEATSAATPSPAASHEAGAAALASAPQSRGTGGRHRGLARPVGLAAAGLALGGGIVLALGVVEPGDHGAAALASASPTIAHSPAPTAKPRATAAPPAPVIRVEPAPPHPKHHGHGKGHD